MIDFDKLVCEIHVTIGGLYQSIQDKCTQSGINFTPNLLDNIGNNLEGSEKKFIQLCCHVMRACLDDEMGLDEEKIVLYYRNDDAQFTNANKAAGFFGCSNIANLDEIQEIKYDDIDIMGLVDSAFDNVNRLEQLRQEEQDKINKLAEAKKDNPEAKDEIDAIQGRINKLDSKLQQKIQNLKSEKQTLKQQIKLLRQTTPQSADQIAEESKLKATLKNLRTLGHLYKIQQGALNRNLENVRFKVKTTTDSEDHQTFVNQSGIEFIQGYLKQLEEKSWNDANDDVTKKEIIKTREALDQYLQSGNYSSLSQEKPALPQTVASKPTAPQMPPDFTLTVTTANAADNPRVTQIVPSIPAPTTSGDPDYMHYLRAIAEKKVKVAKKGPTGTKDTNEVLHFGGLEKRVASNDKRKGNLRRLMGMIEKSRAEANRLSTIVKNNIYDEAHDADEQPEITTPINKDQPQITQEIKLKKLKIKSHIYDDTETRKITHQGNEKLIVTINDPKESKEIKDTTATQTNTYEVSKTNDKDFTMTTKDPLDTIGDKMLVQWIETFKRTEGPNKIMVVSDLFHVGQSPEEQTKAQEIANKIKQYCKFADVQCNINNEPKNNDYYPRRHK